MGRKRADGVIDAVSELQARTPDAPELSDSEIAKEARAILDSALLAPHQRIQVKVSNGWVTLEGEVSTREDRMDVEGAIFCLAEVLGITNNIRIVGPGVNPHDVRKSIGEALERRAEWEAVHISVTVLGGTAYVSGPVHSRAVKDLVLGAALQASGIERVEDHLRIERSL